jgi:hypothetical protein
MSVARGNAEKLSENSLNTLIPVSMEDEPIVEGHAPFIVFSLALSLESVDLVHVVCLVVASVQ